METTHILVLYTPAENDTGRKKNKKKEKKIKKEVTRKQRKKAIPAVGLVCKFCCAPGKMVTLLTRGIQN